MPFIRSTVCFSRVQPIAQCLAENDLMLADTNWNEKDSGDVDILLGADSIHILPVQSCSFGKDHISLFYYTCQGIMLVGDVIIYYQT